MLSYSDDEMSTILKKTNKNQFECPMGGKDKTYE